MQSKFKIGQTVFWTKNKHWYVVEANLSPAFVALEGYPNPVPVAQIKTEEELNETKEWRTTGTTSESERLSCWRALSLITGSKRPKIVSVML